MEEKTLVKASLIFSLAGLAALSYFSLTLESTTTVSSITPDSIGNTVKVCGEVESYFVSRNKHMFFDVADGKSKINVVVFNSTIAKIGLDPAKIKNKDKVCVTGRIDIYQDKLEIIAKKIEAA